LPALARCLPHRQGGFHLTADHVLRKLPFQAGISKTSKRR
jgi:hypothetical protein